MKNRIILFVFAVFAVLSAQAQDRIYRTDATVIEARVTEITPGEVRYKRFSNPEGPTYVLPVKEVRCILYPNGEKDVFNDVSFQGSLEPSGTRVEISVASPDSQVDVSEGDTTPVVAKSVAAPETLTASLPRRAYAVGDYFEDGLLRGVVAVVSDDGQHGLLLSLDEISLPWSTMPKSQLKEAGVSDTADGAVNMRTMEQFIAANDYSWDLFPAFEWCRKLGAGWYLPAIDELLAVCANYNGGIRAGFNRKARGKFNDAMREHGGKRIDRLAYYFSSTERDAKSVICTHVDSEPPFVGDISKNTRFLVRAVHKF